MNLLERLPDFYRNSPESVDILEAVAGCLQDLKKRADSLLNQMQVSTAAWGLDIWEGMYNIPADISKSESERRAVILSRMRTTGSITPEVIRKVAGAFSHGETVLQEFAAQYRFILHISQDIDYFLYLEPLKQAVEEMKPAHLEAEYRLRYTPVSIPETNQIRLIQMGVDTAFWNGYGSDSTRLNGQKRMNGTWLLDQAVQGMRWRKFALGGKWQEREVLRGEFASHINFYLDGTKTLNGSMACNGGIQKEEL